MRPIFIGGSGRSGTTMLASMLGTHSKMLTVPECHLKIKILRTLDGEFCREMIPAALALLKKDIFFKTWKLDKVLSQVSKQSFDGSYRGFIEYFVSEYGRINDKPNFDYWIDHMPGNIYHSYFLLNEFADSKMIHLIRDGRAVAASVLPLDWGPITIREAAHNWSRCIAFGLATEAAFSKNRVIRVHYENLVRQPSRTLKRICDFIGVEFNYNMIGGTGFKLPLETRVQHSLVGTAPDSNRIDAWRNRLSSHKIELFEYYSGSLLKLMNYETTYGIKASPPSSAENFRMNLVELFLPYWRKIYYLKRHEENWHSIFLGKFKPKLSDSRR